MSKSHERKRWYHGVHFFSALKIYFQSEFRFLFWLHRNAFKFKLHFVSWRRVKYAEAIEWDGNTFWSEWERCNVESSLRMNEIEHARIQHEMTTARQVTTVFVSFVCGQRNPLGIEFNRRQIAICIELSAMPKYLNSTNTHAKWPTIPITSNAICTVLVRNYPAFDCASQMTVTWHEIDFVVCKPNGILTRIFAPNTSHVIRENSHALSRHHCDFVSCWIQFLLNVRHYYLFVSRGKFPAISK